jgi:hypothetical protein
MGAVGALAPEIVRLYNIRQQQPEGSFSTYYLFISAAFAALGGILAVILPAPNLLGAFHAGVTTPVLINAALRQGMRSSTAQFRGSRPAAAPDGSLRRFVSGL